MENKIISEDGTLPHGELELINQYALKSLTAQEVFTFTVTLCDNETDRDFDRFSTGALEELAPMFVGKSGIFDHSMRAKDQTARVFRTWVETDPVRTNRQGEPYAALKAKAYCLRTAGNSDFISQVEGGISKEVSVSCSVSSSVCTVCGRNTREEACGHIKGRYYRKAGKKLLCCNILSDPFDAYEWSFVAVPAQKAAGVTKAFSGTSREQSDDSTRSEAELYRAELCGEIKKLAALCPPGTGVSGVILKGMTGEELRSCRDEMRNAAMAAIPSPQLAPRGDGVLNPQNEYFKI